jgi:hypothetical protein
MNKMAKLFHNRISETEADIIERTIVSAFRNGWLITVRDEEAVALPESRDAVKIRASVGHTDETIFAFTDWAGNNRGWVRFIHGNGEDVWSDDSGDRLVRRIFKRAVTARDPKHGLAMTSRGDLIRAEIKGSEGGWFQNG